MRDFSFVLFLLFAFIFFAFTFYAIGYSQGAIDIATDIDEYLSALPH